jgi:hypothetical protein
LIVILALLLLISIVMAVQKFLQPAEVAQQIPVYKYQHQANVDYQVFILSNPFFDIESLEAGRGYLTPITDYISTTLNYQLTGEGPAAISGDYQVDAVVTGYILKGDDLSSTQRVKVPVWDKTYSLVPKTEFDSSDGTITLDREVRVDIREYAEFAQRVQDEYKSSTTLVELAVKYEINTNVETPDGKSTDSISPTLVIPIEGNSFTVDGVLADQKEGTIVAQEMVPVPSLTGMRMGFSMAAFLLALALVGVVKKTRVMREDPLENELKRIIKKYGDRIVAGTGSVPGINEKKTMDLGEFENLLKISDELLQPILYENIKDGVHNFYVIGKQLHYRYTLEPGMFEQPEDIVNHSEE